MISRRRQRAVYRIYGEDEFLGGVGGVGIPEPVVSGAGDRRLRRLAGAAMLAGAIGVVGATITAATTSSGRGGARKLRAGSQPAIGRSVAGTEWRTPRPALRRTRSARSGHRKPRELGVRHLAEVAPALRVAVARAQEPAPMAPSVASADVALGRRERVEFGFER
jgi:hypothetical protein